MEVVFFCHRTAVLLFFYLFLVLATPSGIVVWRWLAEQDSFSVA